MDNNFPRNWKWEIFQFDAWNRPCYLMKHEVGKCIENVNQPELKKTSYRDSIYIILSLVLKVWMWQFWIDWGIKFCLCKVFVTPFSSSDNNRVWINSVWVCVGTNLIPPFVATHKNPEKKKFIYIHTFSINTHFPFTHKIFYYLREKTR